MMTEKPQRRAVIGCSYGEIAGELTKCGIEMIFAQRSNCFPEETANHADMSAFRLPNGLIVADSGRPLLIQELRQLGYDVLETEKPAHGEYPNDILLNCFTLCERLICNENFTSTILLSEIKKCGIMPLNVKQGYARCSTLVIGESAVITDDSCIYNACTSIGADSLLIEKGDIFLSDNHYGFIGGASCMLNDSTAAFFGSLSTHRNSSEIKNFLKSHSVDYIELSDGVLRDIGSVVFL